MKKVVVFSLVIAFILSGCQLSLPTNPAPTVDIAATVNSIAKTAVAQTLAAQPSPTIAPVLNTSTPPAPDISTTPSIPATNTNTPQANLTTTPATATTGPANPTRTSTAAVAGGSTTPSPTNGILTYGTLPPAVPFTFITLSNKSKAEAYISLQVDTHQGGLTVIEYPVKGTFQIKAPLGNYTYVVWVGGKQLTGSFHLSKNDDLIITIYKDKVTTK